VDEIGIGKRIDDLGSKRIEVVHLKLRLRFHPNVEHRLCDRGLR